MRAHWLIAPLLLAACGPVDPAPPTDEAGNVIVVPPPFDRPMVATPLYGELEGDRPVLRWRLDAYLDEARLVDYMAVSLTSGGLTASGRVTWRMADRTLTFRPTARLRDGLHYRPQLVLSQLFSVTGSPLAGGRQPRFLVDAAVATEAEPVPTVTWRDVEKIFAAKCDSCHSDPTWQLTPLTFDALLDARSDQLDLRLVVPYAPGESYLLHKVLPDYPLRRFTVQPPPWSGVAPLTVDEIFVIERWILTGAQE